MSDLSDRVRQALAFRAPTEAEVRKGAEFRGYRSKDGSYSMFIDNYTEGFVDGRHNECARREALDTALLNLVSVVQDFAGAVQRNNDEAHEVYGTIFASGEEALTRVELALEGK